MEILYTPTFAKQLKKLHSNQKHDLNRAIMEIATNPAIGDFKQGDLNGMQVYKFSMVRQQTLLAYEYQEDEQQLVLHFLAAHENFYRDLKKQK